MDPLQATTLLKLTGDLWPAIDTPPEALLDLRTTLLAALLGGQDPAAIGARRFVGDPAGGAEDAIREIVDNPPAASNNRVSHRSTAIRAAAPIIGEALWTLGQTSIRTIGPFQDRGGRLHWFDVFAPGSYFEVFVFGDPEPVALFPAGTTWGPGTLNLSAGSVWLRAQSISPAAPGGNWIGLRIDSGTGTLSGPAPAVPGKILLRPQAGVRLVLNLATNGLAGFPATAMFGISGNGIRVTEFGPGSITAFGVTVSVSAADRQPAYDAGLPSVLVPLTPGMARFDPQGEPLSGSAGIEAAAWALPLTEAPLATLADAEGPGSIALILADGLETSLPGNQGGNIALGKASILSSPARTTVYAPGASNPRAVETLSAWFEERVNRRSAFELRRPIAFPFWLFRLASGAEAVITRAELTLHIDRPLRASGTRLESRILVRQLVERDAAGTRLTLAGSQPPDPLHRFALALSNVLLTVAEPASLELFAQMSTPDEMQSGEVQFFLPLFHLLPTLPDPYAANFDPRRSDQPRGDLGVTVTVIWTEQFAVQFDLRLDPPPFTMYTTAAIMPEPITFRARDALTNLYKGNLQQEPDRGLCLLDVSSNAAQFGIALGFGDQPNGGLSIRDWTLNVGGSNASLFLLPQFQWEPLFNKANPKVLGETEGWRYHPDDGGPTQAAADTVRLIPVRPLRLLEELVSTYSRQEGGAAVLFTLPFGIRAAAVLNPLDRQFSAVPKLEITAPRFTELDGAPQLRLTAGTLQDGQVWIGGQASQVPNMFPSPPPSALGAVIGPNFDIAFVNGVPIERIDLSGYGANIFSRWFLAKNPDVGITQVALDAFNGRTAYERILMTLYLIPCFSRMVRTITLERHGSGAIVRWDSGWEPTTPGLFEHPKHTSNKCAVGGIYNIREVRDTDYIVTLGDGTVLQAVYYDGDIAIENPVRGADSTGRVPARRHLGFIQQLSLPATPPPGPISAPVIDAAQLRELLDLVGPLGGPVDCQIKIGSSQHEMKVTSILAANAGLDQFSVGPYGSPALKGPGQWSVARVNNNSGVVGPIDPTHGIPLIRSGVGPYRWADPADLFTNNPVSDYAFLFSSGAQRVLFPRPKINNLAAQITSIKPPLLADPYALLKAPSLFPPNDKAIPFGPQAWGLDLTGGVLRLSPSPFTVTASTAPGGFNLLNTSSWSVDLAYKSAEGAATQFVIDSAADWAINSTGIRQALTFPILGEVMTIVHKIEAPSAGADSFPEPQVLFSGALDAVMDVLRMLREWAPNLPAPLTVDVSFSGSTFRLSAVADFNIEDADGNAIDCGMGKLKGDLKIGAELSVEVFKRTTNGAVFFEVTGSWQQEVFPLIYGGGLMRFAVRADNSGQPTLELDACVVGSIGGDLIPGLVSLEATVKYGYFLFTNPILPGFMVGIEGRAKLVSGLLGFKLGIEGRIGIARKGPLDLQHICQLHGEILVAGTVTVAWLLDERKSFRTHFDVEVDWKILLVAAKAGLLPVP